MFTILRRYNYWTVNSKRIRKENEENPTILLIIKILKHTQAKYQKI